MLKGLSRDMMTIHNTARHVPRIMVPRARHDSRRDADTYQTGISASMNLQVTRYHIIILIFVSMPHRYSRHTQASLY